MTVSEDFEYVVKPLVSMTWRERLREVIDRGHLKHGMVAREAGITPTSLSLILTGKSRNPRFETVMGIAHAAGVSVGWLLREEGFSVTRAQANDAVKILRRLEETFRKTSAR